MKNTYLIYLATLALCFSTAHSQTPEAPRSAETLRALQALRETNTRLLEEQANTLKKLKELEVEARQIKILGKRS